MSVVRAAVTERPGIISLREFPMPDPAPGARRIGSMNGRA